MTEEEKELEKKYFGLAIELGVYGSHSLANYEHTFSSFYDCESCGAAVHSDKTVKHAKWHEEKNGEQRALLALITDLKST